MLGVKEERRPLGLIIHHRGMDDGGGRDRRNGRGEPGMRGGGYEKISRLEEREKSRTDEQMKDK